MKYRINNDIHTLASLKPIWSISNSILITGNLEIEPFNLFSLEFSSIYWYLNYHILKDNEISINKDEIRDTYKNFFTEPDLNFISLQFYDKSNYKLYCNDGTFYIETFSNIIDLIIKENYSLEKL